MLKRKKIDFFSRLKAFTYECNNFKNVKQNGYEYAMESASSNQLPFKCGIILARTPVYTYDWLSISKNAQQLQWQQINQHLLNPIRLWDVCDDQCDTFTATKIPNNSKRQIAANRFAHVSTHSNTKIKFKKKKTKWKLNACNEEKMPSIETSSKI